MADRLSQKVGGPGSGPASDRHSTDAGSEEGGLGRIYVCEVIYLKVKIIILKVRIFFLYRSKLAPDVFKAQDFGTECSGIKCLIDPSGQ